MASVAARVAHDGSARGAGGALASVILAAPAASASARTVANAVKRAQIGDPVSAGVVDRSAMKTPPWRLRRTEGAWPFPRGRLRFGQTPEPVEDQGRSVMSSAVASEHDAFRQEVAEFVRVHWREATDRDVDAFRKLATARGYLYRSVPVAYGGSEQTPDPMKAHIIREAFARARAPREVAGAGVNMVVPTLLAAGQPWQKEAFIPKTLTGEYRWAQGYSEPGAGSDLASVRTSAVLDGDEWAINGQKVWTSDAQNSNYMFALVRTEPDAPKHNGISYLLLRMDQPGVTVRPLKQITGESHFNEVFLDNARTPKDWIVGERGQGWQVSRTTLVFERNSVGGAEVSGAIFEQLVKLARTTPLNGRPAIQDPLIRDEMMKIQTMVAAHHAAGQHDLQLAAAGRESSPASGATTKLYGSTITEKIAQVAQKIIDHHAIGDLVEGAPGPGRWVKQYMNSIAAQIGGGTSNIQRNVIAERGLGMPRDGAA
jgi:alkylation response protein AidB-like acyl-CoA dehydrogenase